MPDEIDLLRSFRADTPGPDDAAWAKARSAVTAATGTAVAEPAVVAGRRRGTMVAATTAPPQRHLGRDAGRRDRRRDRVRPAPGAADAGRAAGHGMAGGPGPRTRCDRLQVPAGGWRLVSYLVPRGWQESTSGPEPATPSTCPTAQACYVEGNNASSPAGRRT